VAVSKRLRYEVLRRDSYTCRYCGAKAPDVAITVDHVLPVALGGSDDPSNLAAACDSCNGGKTSSSPDAPLVADVAEDALKWAAAMSRAQAAMIADIETREADRSQFQEWWDGWGRGEGAARTLIPKDPTWWVTVDQFIAAGLPLAVLKDCIDRAMTRQKVQDENKFKYMCGIAWSKVTEMQKAASSFVSGGAELAGTAPASTDLFEQGRLSLARELLDELSEEERAHFLEIADMTEWQDEDDEPQTESQQACDAVSSLLNSARCNVDWLVERLGKTLERLPPEIGEPCRAEMAEDVTMHDPISRLAWRGVNALYALEDLIDLPAATAWTYDVSEEQLAEWHAYARALWPDARLGTERWLTRAWTCAKLVAEGGYYLAMCSAPGTHIPDCPVRGTHYAVIAELKCCGPDRAEDHKGHLVCECHLEQLMDGTYIGRGGRLLTITDFTEVSMPEAAPF